MPFSLYNHARKVPPGGSRQGCLLEASQDVRDVAGIIAAACTRTSASPSPGSGIATSSIRNTDGGPNSANRSAFIKRTYALVELPAEVPVV